MINQNIVTLNISMYNTKCVHVLKNACSFESYFDSFLDIDVELIFLHVEKIVKTSLCDIFKDNDYVRNFRHNAHK